MKLQPDNGEHKVVKREERIQEIFAQAREKLAPAERESYLAEACRGEPELRREVESLLLAHEKAGDFLGKTMALPMPNTIQEPIGKMIGRYKVLEKIGEGGFGVVYMAEQTEPLQRKVALKIVKAGMDTRAVIARFEAERQALALMDHPNIARVLDAGATETGRPYFVMELVRGIPITEYSDQANLSTRERLQLFMKVCHAVQHAHQKGVIHRDIKPNNILVTLHDSEPVPKVIDFGVAKALGQKLTEKTLFTGFHDMIGTPAYMSPEQAELSGLDIDTRSDIYSLGVLLYELLTGATPFDPETLLKAALDEIRRMIRETEPPKPSTRLQTMGDKLPAVARHRHAEPAALTRLVRGDLDWIVMKALEKDRRRRYETPEAFASDVARHLNSEPVIAAAPSALYTFQKFVRRHRMGLATASALMVLLAAGTTVSTWQAVRATRAERVQAQLRSEAELARANETKLRLQAEAREKIAQAAFLARSGNPSGAEQLISSVPPLLVEMDAESAAAIYSSLGAWRAGQGQWKAAITNYSRVIEAQPTNFESYYWLAPALLQSGDPEAYQQLRGQMLERFGGTTDPLVADRLVKDCLILPWSRVEFESLDRLADVAVKTGSNHWAWRRFQFAKGLVEYRRGHFADAIQWMREVAEGGEWNRDVNRDVQGYMVLAMAYQRLHQTAYARAALTTGLARAQDGLPKSESELKNWPGWNDWIIAHALMGEARQLIEGASAADTPPGQSLPGVPPEQQQRMTLMKSRGPEASLTILPMRLGGEPFERLSEVVGVLLEQMGLKNIELSHAKFDPGTNTGMEHVILSLGQFLNRNPVTTEYAMYAEYNGIPGKGIVEIRAIVVDKSGEVVWTDHLTSQDEAFRKLEGPDPMAVSFLLVERLSPHLGLDEETRKAAKPGKLSSLMEERSGIPPKAERASIPDRLKSFKESRQKATLIVFPPCIRGREADVASAAGLAKMIADAGLCRAAAADRAAPLKPSPMGPNEMKALWDMARAFRDYAKKNPTDADYALYAEYVFNPQNWVQGCVHFVVCDRNGEWVIVDMQNSDWPDYQSIKPTSLEGCSRLLLKRLEGCLR